ncbi:MAG: class I SAM-dependent methyltransferase [Candidatus Promineifilaceae bacterium]|nr:class I SAM-dependent methyltransferase [Candidatus Promineifilaceae bacterium]
MAHKPQSLRRYDRKTVAERYHRQGGFAADRKVKMLTVALELLVILAQEGGTLLELGAGTGHFTEMIVDSGRFSDIYVTDGASSMLAIAREALPNENGRLHFSLLDFEKQWSRRFAEITFDAVTSSMALHHAADKRGLFAQVYDVLKPGGVFILGDHMAAASELGQDLIGRERALIRLGRKQQWSEEQIKEQMRIDQYRQKIEGDQCESVIQYLAYLAEVGFANADCLWQDYWLAVFLARK